MITKSSVKAAGCLVTLISLPLAIYVGYLNMKYSWGLEVKNWHSYFWLGIVGHTVLTFLAALGARAADE